MSSRVNNPIDFWKGVTILSVLNIHTCFWSGSQYLPHWTRQSALLLDVPVFFFISGYLLTGDMPRIVLRRGLRQFVRLITDYLAVAVAAILLLSFIRGLAGKEPLPDAELTFVSIITMNPQGYLWATWGGFRASIWYLHVYLSLVPCGVPLIAVLCGRSLLLTIAAAIALLYSFNIQYDTPYLLSNLKVASFYLSYLLAGAAFKLNMANLTRFWYYSAWSVMATCTVIMLVINSGLPNLQDHKFPPSPSYFIISGYSVLIFCSLVSGRWLSKMWSSDHPVISCLCWCGVNTYRIYLWQAIAASVPFLFVPRLIDSNVNTVMIYIVTLAWIVFSTLSLVCLHNTIGSRVFRAYHKRLGLIPRT